MNNRIPGFFLDKVVRVLREKFFSSEKRFSSKERFENFCDQLLLIPIEIHEELVVRQGTLVVFDERFWEVINPCWRALSRREQYNLRSILLPNLKQGRMEESEFNATIRVKNLILNSLKPKTNLPDWKKSKWSGGGFNFRSITHVRIDEGFRYVEKPSSNGLAS